MTENILQLGKDWNDCVSKFVKSIGDTSGEIDWLDDTVIIYTVILLTQLWNNLNGSLECLWQGGISQVI